MLQILIDLHKLIVGSDVETRTFFEQRLDYLLIRVCLYRIIALDSRQVFFEDSVILPYFGMVDYKQRRPTLLCQSDKFFFHIISVQFQKSKIGNSKSKIVVIP
jgi:hypothetical protein